MKHIIIITFFTLIFGVIKSQSSSDYEKVAIYSCECLDGKEITEENLELNLGLCILEAISKNKKFKNFNLDDEDELVKVFEQIGYKMGINCPHIFLQSEKFKEQVEEEIENNLDKKRNESPNEKMSGTITGFEGTDLQYILLEDKNNRVYKFLWSQRFDGDAEMLKLGEKAIGKEATITFSEIEMYNPKLNDYLNKKEIVEIEF